MNLPWNLLHALLLLMVSHVTPWAVARVAGDRLAAPLDLGRRAPDGERLFGDHKTWRGLLSGSLACAVVAQVTGFGALRGCGFGALALAGDALSSLLKRRLHRPPGAEVPGLDQLPEALLPLVAYRSALGLSVPQVVAVALGFLLLDIAVTRIRHAD
jgi:CDP-2,3-bis-(O-geranylgeranyl)-sn-glycerol synthase